MYSLLKSHRFSPRALEVALHIVVVCVLHHGANYTEASKEVKTKHLGEKYIPSSRRLSLPTPVANWKRDKIARLKTGKLDKNQNIE